MPRISIAQTESSFALDPADPKPVPGVSALSLNEKQAIKLTTSAELEAQAVTKTSKMPEQQSNEKQAEAATTITQAEDRAVAETGSMSELPKDSRKIGDYLDSLSMLNQVAMNQDAVFIYIPAKTDEPLDSKASDAVLSAQKTLTAKNLKIGLYTLKTSSAEYAKLTSQAQPPSFLVASKGKGMSAVSGEVTETKLLQAFTASSRAGGGCGPSSGCKPGAGC